ncbi:MAG: hypothetical protein N2Z40_04520 [Caldimicrobium sp.]|nr:hypothetical protein [Caldimicrobium sp.]MCX7613468.1 hypothetical protein [Caldimicrobium sp.]MDW8182960.1 hypothetical protein [Caldimicrobium sp.]
MKEEIDPRYRALLNLLQEGFPLDPKPFAVLAKRVGLTEEEVLDFLRSLKEKGILRHLGASPDSHKLGHFTCLCACSLSEEKLHLAQEIANLPEVTHAYLREHSLNFWFTLVLPSKSDLEPYVERLEKSYQIKVHAFPATKKFKVKAVFEI